MWNFRAQYGNMIKNAEDNAKKALKRIWTNYTGEAEVHFGRCVGGGTGFFWIFLEPSFLEQIEEGG